MPYTQHILNTLSFRKSEFHTMIAVAWIRRKRLRLLEHRQANMFFLQCHPWCLSVRKGLHGPAVDPSVCSCPGAEPWPECPYLVKLGGGGVFEDTLSSDVISQQAVGSLPCHPQQHPLESPFQKPGWTHFTVEEAGESHRTIATRSRNSFFFFRYVLLIFSW